MGNLFPFSFVLGASRKKNLTIIVDAKSSPDPLRRNLLGRADLQAAKSGRNRPFKRERGRKKITIFFNKPPLPQWLLSNIDTLSIGRWKAALTREKRELLVQFDKLVSLNWLAMEFIIVRNQANPFLDNPRAFAAVTLPRLWFCSSDEKHVWRVGLKACPAFCIMRLTAADESDASDGNRDQHKRKIEQDRLTQSKKKRIAELKESHRLAILGKDNQPERQ